VILLVVAAALFLNSFLIFLVRQKLLNIQISIDQITEYLAEKNENKHVEDLNNRLSFIQQAKFSPIKFTSREK